MQPTIVTAFFDIGRGGWSEPGLPSYLKRTNDEYFQRFERMLKLENDIIVYTEANHEKRFDKYKKRKSNLTVIYVDNWRNIWSEYREKIRIAMLAQKFELAIQQPWNPEYWNIDYVMINYLKAYFAHNAVTFGHVKTDMVAWLDFGYPREDWQVPCNNWEYEFDPEKIHFFTTKNNVPDYTDLKRLIETNDVFIMGCHIVASPNKWEFLKDEIAHNISSLLEHNIVDDDQTVLYMCFIANPSLYEIHRVDVNLGDWFQIFMKWNTANV